jgi:hypothetical protein
VLIKVSLVDINGTEEIDLEFDWDLGSSQSKSAGTPVAWDEERLAKALNAGSATKAAKILGITSGTVAAQVKNRTGMNYAPARDYYKKHNKVPVKAAA